MRPAGPVIVAGLAVARRAPYLGAMPFLRRFSPIRAYLDLRMFLAQRQPYELGFLVLAMAITGFFVYAFAKDSHVVPVYKPQIVYVEQWPLSRTDSEIRAAQKVDQAKKARLKAAEEAERAKTRATFKKLDDQMNKWGL